MISSAFRTLVLLSNRRVILLVFDPLQSCNYVSQAVVDSLSQSEKLIDSESGRNSEHKDLIYYAGAWAIIPLHQSSILPTDNFYLIVGRKWLQRERVEVFAEESYCTIRDLDYPECLFKFPAYVPKAQRSLQVKSCQPDSQVALQQKLESTILPTADDAQVEVHFPLTPTMVEPEEMIENVAMTDSNDVRETAYIVESWDHSLIIEAVICSSGGGERGIEVEGREGEKGRGAKMVKFLKPNKAVIVLQGRFAGWKAVIVKNFDDGTRDRAYGHCLVAGIYKYPKKVIRKDSAKKTAKKSRVKAFVKLVNYNHIMPTRYTLDVDLKDVVTPDVLQSKDKEVIACKETKARFEERFKTGKNRWFFTKLRF
ncbi:hypothetical protein Taro_016461 [Colocasia esculenta]|uniref:60S ribosomal protein L27 n=1 Tax=Colocasia esculenta TaxID=4460 RepID=A0A843USZ2_COLES|nr:hypothetical protein [Colocasia esculenta]